MGHFKISIQKELEIREYKLKYGVFVNEQWHLTIFREDDTILQRFACDTFELCWLESAKYLTDMGDVIQIKGDSSETLYIEYFEDKIHTIKNTRSIT